LNREALQRGGAHAEADSIAARSVERALAPRQAVYREEVERMVRAGVRVMQRHGDFDPRVGEVVREAGLSNQVFYRHFRSKDEFLLAVLDDGVRELVGYLEHRTASGASPRKRVRRWLKGILAQAQDPEAAAATRPFVIPQARLAERFPEEIDASIRRLIAPLEAAIAEGAESGELVSADPARDARMLYDIALAWLQRALLADTPPSGKDARHLVAFALRGLGVASASE
jgi:AcrR family transcriptional regulator